MEIEIETLLPDIDIRALREHWLDDEMGHTTSQIVANIIKDGDKIDIDEAREMLMVLAFEVDRRNNTIEYLMDMLSTVSEDLRRTLSMARTYFGVKHGN